MKLWNKYPLRVTLAAFAFLAASLLRAQTPQDSLALVQSRWAIQEIAPGVFWKHVHLNEKQLFASNQNVNLVETRLKNRRVRAALVSADVPGDTARRLVKTSELATKAGALVALNGTFFDTKRGGSVDFIRIDGRVLDTTRYTPGKPLAEHQQAAVAIRGRKVRIERAGSETDYGWERRLNAPDVLVTGPLLLWKGQPVPLSKTAFNTNRHPRSAVCVTRDKKLLLLTADGRNAQAQGLSLPELSFVLKQLGCRDAVNLDGGGSTTLYLQGQPDAGVVNRPSDNKQFDPFGERPVSNAILLMRKK
jgi:exopolysaccharide biosynthesis protein